MRSCPHGEDDPGFCERCAAVPPTCISCRHYRDQMSVDLEEYAAKHTAISPRGFWGHLAAFLEGPRGVYSRMLELGPPPMPKPPHCALTDLVTGQGSYLFAMSCEMERRGGRCGQTGRFWEAIPDPVAAPLRTHT